MDSIIKKLFFIPERLRILLIRNLRLLTSRFRELPDYIIIGAQKSGTTSLHQYLKKHPLVRNMRLGNWNEGDTGVTIVELK